jgi:myo-inositol-1(or 4)-monophosphatase
VAGLPIFSTSIALLDQGQPIIGVVVEHNIGLTFAATRGGGARMNDRPIRVLDPAPDDDLMVGVTTNRDPLTQRVLQAWLGEPGLIFRNLGTTALHLAMVACGGLAADYCKKCKIWDIAAGALLIMEAGGRITDVAGVDRIPFSLDLPPEAELPILAAGPKVHERLLKLIVSAPQRR